MASIHPAVDRALGWQQIAQQLTDQLESGSATVQAKNTFYSLQANYLRIRPAIPMGTAEDVMNNSELTANLSQTYAKLIDLFRTVYPTERIDRVDPFVRPLARSVRDVRGDGNCFYSAMAVRLLETAVHDAARMATLESVLDKYQVDLGEPLYGRLKSTLDNLKRHSQNIERFLTSHDFPVFVSMIRRIVASELHKRADLHDLFQAVLIGNNFESTGSIDEDIEKFVKRMGVDAVDTVIGLAAEIFQFPVQIIRDGHELQVGHGEPLAMVEHTSTHYRILYERAPKINPTGGMIEIQFEGEGELTIRGDGAGLSWDQDALLTKVGANRYVYRFSGGFEQVQFKVLCNGEWESGENHTLKAGERLSLRQATTYTGFSTIGQYVTKPRMVMIHADSSQPLTLRGSERTGLLGWETDVPMFYAGSNRWIAPFYGNGEFKVLAGGKWQAGANLVVGGLERAFEFKDLRFEG